MNFPAADPNHVPRRIVHTHKEVRKRCFASPRAAHDAERLSALHVEGNIAQHILIRSGIAEGKVFHTDVAAQRFFFTGREQVGNVGFRLQHSLYALEGRRAACNDIDDPADGGNRPHKHVKILNKRRKIANADLPEDGNIAAICNGDGHGAACDHMHERKHERLHLRIPDVGGAGFHVDCLKRKAFLLFLYKRLNHFYAVELFLHEVGHLGKCLLPAGEPFMHFTANKRAHQSDKAKRQDGHDA